MTENFITYMTPTFSSENSDDKKTGQVFFGISMVS
jgi:hypothetical protein